MASRVIKCARCGSETPATGPRTQYCPSCAYIIRLEKQNARRSNGRKHAEHTKIITCEICGKEIVVSSKAARAKYCPECSSKAFRASAKKYKDKEKNTIICVRCGAEVVLKSPQASNRMYCDDCQKIVYAELNRKAKAAAKERKRTDGLQGDQKRCARCGVIFEKRGYRKYCDDCRSLAKNELTRTSYERMKNKRIGICHRCGIEFTYIYKGSERALCDDCKNIYKSGSHAEREVKRKKKAGPTLAELEREARKKGMSYGKYKVWLESQYQKGAKKK